MGVVRRSIGKVRTPASRQLKEEPMRWLSAMLLICALLAARPAVAQDEATIKGAFIMCGMQHVLIACDDLVKMPDMNDFVRSNAYATRASVLIGSGRLDEAKRDLAQALKLNPQNDLAGRALAMIGNADPNSEALSFNACLEQADAGGRIGACTNLISLYKDDNQHEAAALDMRAKAFLDAGRFDDAIADQDAADRLMPGREGAAEHRLRTLTIAGRYPDALKLARKAVAAAQSPDADLLHAKAELLYLTGDRLGAVEAYEATYRASPQSVMAKYWSVIIRMELGRDAQADLRALLDHPMMSPLGAAIIRLRLHEGGSQPVLDEAQISGPDAACIAYFNLGHDAWLRGDLKTARSYLAKALQSGRTALPEYRAAKLIGSKL
jgi:tetratricopeptide (TPR) repeat protein